MPPLPKKATTCLPSVAHVAEAHPFILWVASGVPVQTVSCQTIVPRLRSTQNMTRCLPLSNAEVKKIRSPAMTGDDCPLPGNSVFQAMEFLSHFTGTLVSGECPSLAGPRHCGQSPSAANAV